MLYNLYIYLFEAKQTPKRRTLYDVKLIRIQNNEGLSNININMLQYFIFSIINTVSIICKFFQSWYM